MVRSVQLVSVELQSTGCWYGMVHYCLRHGHHETVYVRVRQSRPSGQVSSREHQDWLQNTQFSWNRNTQRLSKWLMLPRPTRLFWWQKVFWDAGSKMWLVHHNDSESPSRLFQSSKFPAKSKLILNPELFPRGLVSRKFSEVSCLKLKREALSEGELLTWTPRWGSLSFATIILCSS